MYTLTYEVWRRSNTRSTQYTWTAVQAVFNRFGLTHKLMVADRVACVEFKCSSKDDALATRRAFEAALRTVHRNIAYILRIAS